MFALYTRATDTPMRQRGSLGLGLFISKVIVDHQGGTLGFASAQGQGSTFALALPAGPAENAESALER